MRGHQKQSNYDIQPSPTSKTPEYFGTPFLEHNGFNDGRWEVNHHTYDFSVDRVFSAISVANKIARNTTDSVHVHLVFPMKKKNPNFGFFRRWFKSISDYFFIMGFEESLHPGEYTQMSFLKNQIKAKNIVSNQEDIVGWVNKMFTVGLRSGDTYKVNYESRFQKIGLELRDVTRDMKRLREYVNQTIRQIQDQVWEKGALSQTEIDNSFSIEFDSDIDLKLLNNFFEPKIAWQIYSRYPFVVLPLRQLENQSYYNYKTQSLRRPTESESKALIAAREAYMIDLENLQKELVNFAKKGERVEDEIIDIALKWNLTDWSKRSRLSSLINPF